MCIFANLFLIIKNNQGNQCNQYNPVPDKIRYLADVIFSSFMICLYALIKMAPRFLCGGT